MGALADLAFLTDDARKALELVGHVGIEPDNLVEQPGDLAVAPRQILRQTNRKVAAAEAAQRA
jgi:hypothetical protein